MGCCHSSPSSDASPYGPNSIAQARTAHSSRANIAPQTLQRSQNSIAATPPRFSGSRRISTSEQLHQTPNAPLKAPSPWKSADFRERSHGERRVRRGGPGDVVGAGAGAGANGGANSAWSRSRLRRERDEFFDTRVSGRAEMWGALRLLVEMVRAGDVEGAQGVLDASGCTCPSGELSRGVYDAVGNLYQLPVWVVCDPVDVGDDEGEEGEGKEEEGKEEEGESGREEGEERRRDEKGKGRMGEAVKVKCRLSDRGADVVVGVERDESVKVLVRRVQEAAGITGKNRIKIVYLGRVLKENKSLSAQGWREGHVVNAMVFA